MMKNKIILFLLIIAGTLFSQCSVDSIVFQSELNCDTVTGRYVIPVEVTYTGDADSIKIDVTGLDYPFESKYLLNPHHGSQTNRFNFQIFDSADGQSNNIAVTITCLGGDCNNETLSVNYTNTFSDCSEINNVGCPNALTLSNTITGTETYQASDSIISTQVIDSLGTLTLGANNFVKLEPGFHAKSGSTVTINNSGCN